MVHRQAAAEAEVQSPFVSALSMAQTWKEAVEEVGKAAGSGFEAGFAFIGEDYVDQATSGSPGFGVVLDALREKLGVRSLVGAVVPGTIGQATGKAATAYGGSDEGPGWPPIEVERGPMLTVGLFRQADATPFFLGQGDRGDLTGDVELLNRKAESKSVRSILVVADPFSQLEPLMSTLDESFPKAVKAGGISSALQVGSSERQAYTPSIAISTEGNSARLVSQGLVGLLLCDYEVSTVVCQGCQPAGPSVRVTGVQDVVITGIGGRPANEAIRYIFSNVDPEMREKMRSNLLIGLGPPGQEGGVGDGDWLIRGISGVTPDGGLVVVGASEGQSMRFHVRDRESAEKDRDLMLNRFRLERSLSGGSKKDPVGCFLFTCNGRGENLYGKRHVDARALARFAGDDAGTHVSGFFCNGEIGAPGLVMPSEEGTSKVRSAAVHGFTAVYALLTPAQSP